MINNPCYKCETRHDHCHGNCKKESKYKETEAEKKAAILEAKEKRWAVDECRKKAKRRSRK